MAKKNEDLNNPYLRVLFYGQPGSTKTRTVGTACLDDRTWPVLWLNAAGNPTSIRSYERLPDIIDIEELKDVNDPYNWIMNGQDPGKPFAKKFDLGMNGPYKSLVVDQGTDIQRIAWAKIQGTTELGPGDIGKPSDRRDFYSVLDVMIRFSKLYFDLPMHVMMTALEKSDRNELTGAITYAPLFWGQSDTEIPGYALIVARLVHRATTKKALIKAIEDSTGDEVIHSIALFKPSGTYLAKDQMSDGRIGDYMKDPSIGQMLDLIYGKE